MTKMLATLLVVMAVASHTQAQEQQLCDVCVGDGLFDATLTFGGLPCSEWFEDASSNTPDAEEICYLQRTSGAKFCGCGSATQQFETCFLCGDAASNAQANDNKILPDSPGFTCADIYEMPNVDDGVTCPLLQEKYQQWCGCPNVAADNNVDEPSCPFCQGGGDPNLALTSPFLDGGRSCADLDNWYKVQTASVCPDVRQADSIHYLIDMPAYCECPNHEPPRICSSVYCPEGTGIALTDLTKVIDETTGITCGDSTFLLEHIQNPQDCELFLSTAELCCKTSSEVFTATGGTSAAATASMAKMGPIQMVMGLWMLAYVVHQ